MTTASAENPDIAVPPEPEVQTVIQPPSGWAAIDFKEMWQYRDLLWFFFKRDLTAQYKQTVLGPFWIIFPPLFQTVVFTVLLGGLAGMKTDPIPVLLFIFAGNFAWAYFATPYTATTNCLRSNQNIFTKVYFPRLMMPLTSTASGLFNTVFLAATLIIIMAVMGVAPTWRLVFFPLFLLIGVLLGLGMGLWLAALSVKYRDVGRAGGFISQFLRWSAPCVYTSEWIFNNENIDIPHWAQILYKCNPLYWLVDGLRWSIFPVEYGQPDVWILPALAIVALFLVSGMMFFSRVQATFADTV